MKELTTYVGMDAHKKGLFIAMLVGDRTTAVTWQVANTGRASGSRSRDDVRDNQAV